MADFEAAMAYVDALLAAAIQHAKEQAPDHHIATCPDIGLNQAQSGPYTASRDPEVIRTYIDGEFECQHGTWTYECDVPHDLL